MKIRRTLNLIFVILLNLSMTFNVYAHDRCVKLLKNTDYLNDVSGTGEYLDTSFLPGLEPRMFERLANGGMVSAESGAFVCNNCSGVHRLTNLTAEDVKGDIEAGESLAELECPDCGGSVDMRQKARPPMIVIKKGGQIYVTRYSFIRDKQVVEFFEKESAGCASCGTLKLIAGTDCPNCGDTAEEPLQRIDPEEIDYNAIRRNPGIIAPQLVKMGLISPSVAREHNLLSDRELYLLAQERMDDGVSNLERVIMQGYIHPQTAVNQDWITLKEKREAVVNIINSDAYDITAFEAIERGWLAKGWAVANGLISAEDAASAAETINRYNGGPANRAEIATRAARGEDVGEDDQTITSPVLAGPPRESVRVNPDAGFWPSNLTEKARKRIIRIGVGVVSAAAIVGAMFIPYEGNDSAEGVATILGIDEYMVVYETEEMQRQYENARVDIDTLREQPVPGIEVYMNSDVGEFTMPTEGFGTITSVLTLEVNDELTKIYKQGPASVNFGEYSVGDEVPIEAIGVFDFRLAE